MQFRRLGASDLNVSVISLGSWLTYGVGVEAQTARACLDRAFDLPGSTFIDTANVYAAAVRLRPSSVGLWRAGRETATSWPPRSSSR